MAERKPGVLLIKVHSKDHRYLKGGQRGQVPTLDSLQTMKPLQPLTRQLITTPTLTGGSSIPSGGFKSSDNPLANLKLSNIMG